MADALTAQTMELLQQLIRNQCVNDSSVTSYQPYITGATRLVEGGLARSVSGNGDK